MLLLSRARSPQPAPWLALQTNTNFVSCHSVTLIVFNRRVSETVWYELGICKLGVDPSWPEPHFPGGGGGGMAMASADTPDSGFPAFALVFLTFFLDNVLLTVLGESLI